MITHSRIVSKLRLYVVSSRKTMKMAQKDDDLNFTIREAPYKEEGDWIDRIPCRKADFDEED